MPDKSTPSSNVWGFPETLFELVSLVRLSTDDIVPSRNNPRHLFDRPQLDALKKNIGEHGGLVPITSFPILGSTKIFNS